MKRILITISLLTIFNCLYSQNRVSFSVSFSPVLSNSYLVAKKDSLDNSFLSSKEYVEGRNNADKSLLGFKTGIHIIYKTSSNLSFYSGIGYLHQKVSHSQNFPTGRYEIDNNLIVNRTDYYSYDATYNYFSLPIGVLFMAYNADKFEIGLNGGFSLDYLISNNDINPTTGLFEPELYTVNDFCIEINIGLECNYKFNQKTSLFLRPNFNYFLTPNLIDKGAVSQHNYYTGLDFGLNYIINGH